MKELDEKKILEQILLPLNTSWEVSEVVTNERNEEIFVNFP